MTEIFVFGSNLAGRHGKGAALHAVRHYGAERGVGRGPTGRAYAIPTKDAALRVRSYDAIKRDVYDFMWYAAMRPHETYMVTQIGCGLAGLEPETMAMMFEGAPHNCAFDTAWSRWLGPERTYWGTHP
ncbi:MAG TPA: hypothetical protein DDW89_09850 [Gammaproteobacteria bacterium]|nr:hypothetical protein [Gammaproteobacteria bacterium]